MMNESALPLEDGIDKYKEFVTMQYSSNTLLIVAVANTIFNVFIFPEIDVAHSSIYGVFYTMMTLLRFAAVGMLWIVWTYKRDGSILAFGPSPYMQCSWVLKVQALFPVLMTVVLFLIVVTGATDQPHVSGQIHLISCALKAYPVVTAFILRDTNPIALGISWIMCILTLFVNGAQTHSCDRLSDTLNYTFVTVIILYDTYRKNVSMFRLVTKLVDTLKENESLAVEAQALELRAMIGNVAHDLKTPLTSFLGGVEFMKEVLASWERAEGTVDFCAKAVENFTALRGCLRTMEGTNGFMTMTINRCLDYTKASKGFKLVPKYETVTLANKMQLPLQWVHDQQSCSSVKIQVIPYSSDICTHIITDRQWLLENLLCLLSNAVKYSAKGTVEVSVALQTPEAEAEVKKLIPHLRFEVQDTGIGLSEEAMQFLFNPFKQAQRLAGGTGLGLYSLAKKVEALHGQYGVSKRPDRGQGSLFWFTIPYRPDEMSAQSAAAAVDVTTDPAPPFSSSSLGSTLQVADAATASPEQNAPVINLHVLVVDDAPMIVKMTTMLLTRKGHTVQHAVNGAEALEKIQQGCSSDGNGQHKPFNVVLMDLQMPVLDGIEALRRLRAAEAASRKTSYGAEHEEPVAQFVIALSANSDEGTRQEALEAGADFFMPKPFTYDNFLEVLARRSTL